MVLRLKEMNERSKEVSVGFGNSYEADCGVMVIGNGVIRMVCIRGRGLLWYYLTYNNSG